MSLDDLEACDGLADQSAVASASVKLLLPEQEDPIPHAVLQRLQLDGQLRVQERRDAE